MPHELHVIDLTPRFLDFYERASHEGLDPDARWTLWQEAYGFAAVPPTPEGSLAARALLDAAWDRYPAAMERIRAGAAGMRPDPLAALRDVATLLEREEPVHMKLIAFVGGFEGNPFVVSADGVPALALPVEQEPEQRAFLLPHEMTHVVHMANAGMAPAWERTVARLVLEEGLATRATERLVPGRTPAEYVNETEPGWFERCEAEAARILLDVRASLEDASSEAMARYTVAPGPGGLTRTAYYAGWAVVGALTRAGWTLACLSEVEEPRMPELVRAGIDLVLAEAGVD